LTRRLLTFHTVKREPTVRRPALGRFSFPPLARHVAVAAVTLSTPTRLLLAQDTTNAWDAAHASAAVTICLRTLGPSTAMTQEAVHRIEAELAASGFLVDHVESEAAGACSPSDPNIKLRPVSTGIDISASAGPGDDPVSQTVNASDPATTAELIAIRAVEGLRAAMIQALRRSPDGADAAPESVRRFTRQQQENPPEAQQAGSSVPAPDSATPLEPETSVPGRRRDPVPGPDLLLTLGAGAVWDGGAPGMNVALGVAWLLPPLAIGASFDAGIVAARLPCGRSWECQVGVAAGLRQFSISATSAPGDGPPVTAQENHSSAVVLLDALLGYFPTPGFGLFLRGQGGTLLDAPSIDVGTESMTWGRPSIGVTLGAAARF
jgi:hypothetical protein